MIHCTHQWLTINISDSLQISVTPNCSIWLKTFFSYLIHLSHSKFYLDKVLTRELSQSRTFIEISLKGLKSDRFVLIPVFEPWPDWGIYLNTFLYISGHVLIFLTGLWRLSKECLSVFRQILKNVDKFRNIWFYFDMLWHA